VLAIKLHVVRVHSPNNQQFVYLQLSAPAVLGVGAKPFTGAHKNSPMLVFPKYNNYLLDRDKFDTNSKVLVPLHLLGIKSLQQGKAFYSETWILHF
jgi:hypothetical protein